MIEFLPPRFEAADHSDRLTTALELLSDNHLPNRLAGIYALEALRREVPATGGQVISRITQVQTKT